MKLSISPQPVRIPGFLFSGVACGIKESGNPDLAVIYAERPATVAAAFTTNRVPAAPVQVARQHAQAGQLRSIVVNSGNANAFTGLGGLQAARGMCRIAGEELRIPAKQVLPCSTGRIGVPLPMDRVEAGIRAACRSLSPDGFHSALAAIMTTDAFPKFSLRHMKLGDGEAILAGMAKGAGMIAPRLALGPHATLLAFLLTDAPVTREALQLALRLTLPESFNAAVVDGDTSTNDTVVLLASGATPMRPITPRSGAFRVFLQAAREVTQELARMVVRDGEGATRIVDVVVRGARSRTDAERAADAVARSPLCKAAFAGGDPYMGRVVCALGYSGARFDPAKIRIYLDDLLVVDRGIELVSRVEREAQAIANKPEFRLTIDLRAGTAEALRICSDLTEEYVRFNSAYRT